MAFPEQALYTTKHLSFDRAGERSIDHRHARLCAGQGIEHMPTPDSIAHDFQIPETPHITLRIITTADRKVAKTGYYLPTDRAVQDREAYQAKLQHAQGVEKARRQDAVASQQKASQSKASQRAKQLQRAHDSGHTQTKPSKKCEHCVNEGWV